MTDKNPRRVEAMKMRWRFGPMRSIITNPELRRRIREAQRRYYRSMRDEAWAGPLDAALKELIAVGALVKTMEHRLGWRANAIRTRRKDLNI